MKDRGTGVIVNIIGGAGRSPRYDYICGGTGNAALMAFTRAVGGHSVDWGVRVFGVNPAQTRTDRIISLSRTRAKIRFGDEERWEEMLTGLPLEPADRAGGDRQCGGVPELARLRLCQRHRAGRRRWRRIPELKPLDAKTPAAFGCGRFVVF